MYLILVHIGPEFPTYLNDCIQQIRYVSNIEIIILIDNIHVRLINGVSNTKIVPLDSIKPSIYTENYLRHSVLDSKSRGGFWLNASLRFFLIHDYIQQNNLKNVFHIEYDNLIYYDFTQLLHVFEKWPMMLILDAPSRCIPSFVYLRNADVMVELLQQLTESGMRNENDMTALALYAARNPTIVGRLPIVTPDYSGIDSSYSTGLHEFGVLFDGAAIGQFIGGVDPANRSGDSCGFVNETTVFKADCVKITWQTRNGLRYPYLNGYPLVNLHIHSKHLRRWMSKRIDFITGEKIQEIGDVYCGLAEDFRYNPRICKQVEKHLNLAATPPTVWNNPKVVFCYSHKLRYFRNWLNVAANDFILICHNSDENITGSYADIVDHPRILAIYSQNVMYDHPKLFCLPIGIANSMWPHGNLLLLESVINMNIKKTENIYFYFNLHTNMRDRLLCKQSFEKLGFVFGKQESYINYLKSLAACKFAVCPTGNGIDSHRLWECLYLGVTPIVLRNGFTNKFSKTFPCVLLENWNDFNLDTVLCNWKYIAFMDELNMDYLRSRILDAKNMAFIHS